MALDWGTRIERGYVEAVHTVGDSTTYDVKSMDRQGITAFGIKGSGTYSAGDPVYFFVFSNGKGLILGDMA